MIYELRTMNSLHLEIVTPERIAYADEVDMVEVPGADGVLGILPGHVPLFAQLIEGELVIKKREQEFYLALGGGFIEVTKAKVTILVTRAVHADELNEAEILKAKQAAEEALKHPMSETDYQSAQLMLRKSLLDLRIINRKRRMVH